MSVHRGGRGVCLSACWDIPTHTSPPGKQHTVNEWPVCILLECIPVKVVFCIGGPRGAPVTEPIGFKFFHFHAVFGKHPLWELEPLRKILDPSLICYHPQCSCSKVMFSQVSVILFTGGHAWQGGMCCSRDGHASYWNAFWFCIFLVIVTSLF